MTRHRLAGWIKSAPFSEGMEINGYASRDIFELSGASRRLSRTTSLELSVRLLQEAVTLYRTVSDEFWLRLVITMRDEPRPRAVSWDEMWTRVDRLERPPEIQIIRKRFNWNPMRVERYECPLAGADVRVDWGAIWCSFLFERRMAADSFSFAVMIDHHAAAPANAAWPSGLPRETDERNG